MWLLCVYLMFVLKYITLKNVTTRFINNVSLKYKSVLSHKIFNEVYEIMYHLWLNFSEIWFVSFWDIHNATKKNCGVRDGFLFHVSSMEKHIFQKNRRGASCLNIYFLISKLDVTMLDIISSFDPILSDYFTSYFIKIG